MKTVIFQLRNHWGTAASRHMIRLSHDTITVKLTNVKLFHQLVQPNITNLVFKYL